MCSQNIGVFNKVKFLHRQLKIRPFYEQSVRGCQRNLLLLAMDASIREWEETKKQGHEP